MSEMMKVEEDEPGGISLETPIPAASDLEETQDTKHLSEQQLLVVKEELPDLWSCCLDQKTPEPLQIKKEEEELWDFQEGEQLTVKREDEEKPKLHQIKAEGVGETEAPINSMRNNQVSGEDNNLWGSRSENKGCDDSWRETRMHQSDVDGNMGRKTVKKAFSCPECCKEFVKKQTFQKHMACHSGEKSSSCSVQKEKRRRAKAGKTSVVCDKCGKSVRNDYYLKHVRLHTGEKPFSCNECGKKYEMFESLKVHMTLHTKEKPFQCDECGKQFALKTCLSSHMSIHTGEKPFACTDCDRRFRTKGDLQGHMVTHTGMKPFICCFCGLGFTQKGSLVYHVRHHTGENMYACDVCDKRFVRKCHLDRHVLTHSKERKVDLGKLRYPCHSCGKKFLNRLRLTRHMLTHAEKKAFSFEACFKRFSGLESLNRHMKTFHNK